MSLYPRMIRKYAGKVKTFDAKKPVSQEDLAKLDSIKQKVIEHKKLTPTEKNIMKKSMREDLLKQRQRRISILESKEEMEQNLSESEQEELFKLKNMRKSGNLSVQNEQETYDNLKKKKENGENMAEWEMILLSSLKIKLESGRAGEPNDEEIELQTYRDSEEQGNELSEIQKSAYSQLK